MKPPPFEYHAPDTIEEALAILANTGEEARVIAGGQSLVPLLNMRLARPELLVDLNRIASLAGVSQPNPDMIRIGAMTRQRTLETDSLVSTHFKVLAEAAKFIAHIAIRTRGTVGGSLAHADPAAELPAMMLLLDAEFITAQSGGVSRRLSADQFFVGPWSTTLETGEILEAVEIKTATDTGFAFSEVARVNGAFALVGAGAAANVGRDHELLSARIAFCGLSSTPRLLALPSEIVKGRPFNDELIDHVAAEVWRWAEPIGDIHARPEYRRRVAVALARRVLPLAVQRATVGATS